VEKLTAEFPLKTAQWHEEAVNHALSVVKANIFPFGQSYPDDCSVNGIYQPRPAGDGMPVGANRGWTTGFWPGMLWLSFELSGDPVFKQAGIGQVADFAQRIEIEQDIDTHDLGFLYSLSCVAANLLAGDEQAKYSAMLAADALIRRLLEPAGIVQAWGKLSDPAQRGRTIIDSLMNMPLLYWASSRSGNPRYRDAAVRHTRQLAEHIIRADDSTFHTFWWDLETGAPLRGSTAQGHADDSCWARGQAWGIYGFALNHRHAVANNEDSDGLFLDSAIRCADYFLAHLPDDKVPFWDLVFAEGSDQPRDASAGAIAVCGLLELAESLDDSGAPYRDAATEILESLVEKYATKPGDGSNALLLHGVYDMPKLRGVDEANLWGDYFFLEALLRTRQPWNSYW
jgi:unsaturated chondroitin disaccharide hydrolase